MDKISNTGKRGRGASKTGAGAKARHAPGRASVAKTGSKAAAVPTSVVKKPAVQRPQTNRELREVSLRHIYDSALRLFVEQGYRATTVDDIAAGAGLTKGGVYFYIQKKEHLMLQMLDSVAERYIDNILAKIEEEDLSPPDRLVAFIHSQVNFARAYPHEVMLLVMSSVEFAKGDSNLTAKINEIYYRMRRFIEKLLRDGRQRGIFKTGLSAPAFASFYVATHDGMMLEWYRRGTEVDGAELVRAFREALLRTLA